MSGIKIFNIKTGMPTVEEARDKLKDELFLAQKNGIRIMKIIHGYGSTGIGGKLKDAVRKSLLQRRKEGLVEHIIFGEKFDNIDPNSEKLLRMFPFLRNDSDYKKKNEGITIVILTKRRS